MPLQPRSFLPLALALALAACATQQGLVPTAPPAAPVPSAPLAPSSVPPTVRPTLPPIAPSQTHMPAPTALSGGSSVTALPAHPSTTAIPDATATPVAGDRQAAEHSYVFPVHSDGQISYGRFHHDYPATDIFCPIGSQFLAPTDGVVDFVSREDRWDSKINDGATRGGLSVAIVGDDGVRYYGSHLSRVADGIEPGVRVEAGQLLGLTGKSGDARFTDPHLHFGISHPTTPDDWQVRRGEIPPYEYLKAWQRGENVTPDLTG